MSAEPEPPEGVPKNVVDEYRDACAMLCWARVNSYWSPDDLQYYERTTEGKPSRDAAHIFADKVAHYQEMYPNLDDPSTDEINVAERVFPKLRNGIEQQGGTIFMLKELQQEVAIIEAALSKAGPFKISTLVESTETTDQIETAFEEGGDSR